LCGLAETIGGTVMRLPKYRYDEDNGLIYKLKGDYYYPEIWTETAERDFTFSAVGRAKLKFMKEHEPELYVKLVEQGELSKYIKVFCNEFENQVDLIAKKMGNDSNAYACAHEIVYAQMFERR